MERQKKYDEDIINYLIREGKVYLTLFNIHHGMLLNKKEFVFDDQEDLLDNFIKQYYSENEIPKEIIIPKITDPSISDFLSKLKGSSVRIVAPKKGEKKELLELVKKNIEISNFGDIEMLEALKNKLKMNETPYVIECFDISHLSGTSTVGSMVQFRNAKPDKSNYRRFKIRSVVGIDDFAAINEVVRRRYSRLKNEGTEMPNLIVIDGGKGQLKAAMDALRKLDVRIPIISIAKRLEEIYVPGRDAPFRWSRKDKALQIIQKIRDEAHRFAIKYNRLLRSREIRGKRRY
jgi:excinuclease ABC subunit C